MMPSRQPGQPLWRVASVFLLLLTLSACSSVVTQRDYDPSRDFASYHSWGWTNPPVEFAPNNSLTRNGLTAQRLNTALENQLPGKGLVPAAHQQRPDIRIQATVAEVVRTVDNPFYDNGPWGPYGPYGWGGPYGGWGGPYGGWGGPYGGWGRWGGYYGPPQQRYNATILQLDMYDSRDGQLIWRSRVEKQMDSANDPAKRAQQLAGLVSDALKAYPPSR